MPRPPAPRARPSAPGSGGKGVLLALGLLVLPAVAAVRTLDRATLAGLGAWAALASLAAFAALWHDKRSAERKDWRQPELHLHVLEFLGGWPGSLVAQQAFRHKTAKGRYRVVFGLIVAGYELLALDALLGWPVLGTLSVSR